MRPDAMASTRLPALVLVALMMLPATVPTVAADHWTGTVDVPVLPPVRPDSRCAETALPPYVLNGVQPSTNGNATTYFAFNGTVPLLCVTGQPLQPYVEYVRRADAVLEDFRALAREVQRQVDQRPETTLPRGNATDLVRPTYPILDDRFDGNRKGGFGEWTVITKRGEPEAWTLERTETINGTEGRWRFGDAEGYARGVHQWLVSPELDLGAVRANEPAVQALIAARMAARDQLRITCNNGNFGGVNLGDACGDAVPLSPLSGSGLPEPDFGDVFDAYQRALDDVLRDAPVMRETATLDLTYRLNLASQLDGVRVWLYRGARAPDRVALYAPTFGQNAERLDCLNPVAPGDTDVAPADTVQCSPDLRGGRVLSQLPHADNTVAFREDAPLSKSAALADRHALTGDVPQMVTARVNLTDYSGERLWLLFEVKTTPDTGREEGFFDAANFPRQKDFGFELAHVNATGEGYLRNFRAKDVGGEMPAIREPNPWGDNATRTSVAAPGRASTTVRVHNAGHTTENGTVTVRLSALVNGRESPMAMETQEVNGVKPGEARTLRFSFHNVLAQGTLYRYNVSLVPQEVRGVNLAGAARDPNRTLDPDATAVRLNNSASMGLGGNLTASVDFRAAEIHALTPARASGETGAAFEVCSEVSPSLRCTPSYAARKGEPRTLLLGVRNDGTLRESFNATLHLTLDGQDRTNAILDGATRTATGVLPGETRPFQWTLNPTDPGTYVATVYLRLPDESVAAQTTRLVFVQRSAGLVCLDDFSEARECGPSFIPERPDALAGRTVTAAAYDAQGRLHVATDVDSRDGNLFVRDAQGEWSHAAPLNAIALGVRAGELGHYGTIRDMLFAPDGTLYLAGGNRTLLAHTAEGVSQVPLDEHVGHTDLTALAWWNRTLYAAGTNGTLVKLLDGKLQRENVTRISCTASLNNTHYRGGLNDLAVFQNRLYAAGQGGALFMASVNRSWETLSTADSTHAPTVRSDGTTTCPGASGGQDRDLHALLVHEGALYAAGDGGLLLRNTTAAPRHFARVSPVTTPGFHVRDAFHDHLGRAIFLSADGRLATCAECAHVRDGRWTFPELPVPSVPVGKDFLRATLVAGAASTDVTTLVGQGGIVMDLADRGFHRNREDWTAVSPLMARDGGAWQTKMDESSTAQALRFEADDAGRLEAARATQFRVTLHHYAKRAEERAGGEIRLLFEDYPNFRTGGALSLASAVSLCPRDSFTGKQVSQNSVDLGVACHREEIMRVVKEVRAPTAGDRWERVSATFTPPLVGSPRVPTTNDEAARTSPASAQYGEANRTFGFFGVEFYREDGEKPVLWAVDDVLVEGLVGNQWVPILYWYGPSERFGMPPGVDATPVLGVDQTALPEWVVTQETFGVEPRGAWHLTTALAERPVFALNDEQFTDGLSTPAEPHLRGEWNARLLSPVLNLSDAHDPVVSFRHLYAFRTYTQEAADGSVRFQHGDTGRVEVQWLKTGPEECPGAGATDTCGWSDFIPVKPVGGYPNAVAAGFGTAQAFGAGVVVPAPKHEEHDEWGPAASPLQPGKSFWGRNMEPNDRNAFDAPRDLANYEEVRINLKDAECGPFLRTQCLPTLAGRQIRVAFHVITPSDAGGNVYNHTAATQVAQRTSFGGEGWYVADFKVAAARTLGVDLRAENLTFPVGFDWKRIGVGPATKVPVNVTVVNRGAFEALGHTGELRVLKVVDPIDRRTELVDRLALPQQPELDPGASVNHTLTWNVPAEEGATYLLEFTLTPIGIDRDEDPTDNAVALGSFVAPVLARTYRDHRVELLVTPENATTDITRYVPIYVHNTGNVPQSGITLTRDVRKLGAGGALVDRREFTLERPVPQGARVPLASVATLDPTDDLFWKAPERADYLFTLGSLAEDGKRASAEKRVSAFATFLFDDVEGGARGESFRGEWSLADGWGRVEDDGFRSAKSIAFGDVDADRYPAGADASALTPLVDLSGARSARVAFYHRYAFEPRFDAGVLEASADGGKTWTTLTPVADPLNGLPLGYVDAHPLSAASPLHPDGDPDNPALGFSGDSSELPGAVDGWTLSQFDLTDFAAITERDVPYESFRSEQLQSYRGTGDNLTLTGARRDPAVVTDKTWFVGAEEQQRYWEVQNLTHGSVTSVAGNGTFWWSGSASIDDDGKRPLGNNALNVTVNLTGLRADDGKTVMAEWWEWSERYNEKLMTQQNKGGPTDIPLKDLRSVASFHTGVTSQNWRFNLSEPVLVAKEGKWLKFQSDLSALKGRTVHVQFVYAPVVKSISTSANAATIAAAEKDESRYEALFLADRGFALDGFTVTANRIVNGQTLRETLVDEETAWAKRDEYDCDRPVGGGSNIRRIGFSATAYACFSTARLPHVRQPVLMPGEGRSWTLVETLPRIPGSWAVVPVRDENGRDLDNRLATGAAPSAWWTGDVLCKGGEPCQVPGSDTRLVTPVVDLGRIAGSEAVLTFDHRYAFQSDLLAKHPFASGGVVEIQELDPQTGEWSAWKQIYARPDRLDVLGGSAPPNLARDGAAEGLFGGYSGYTVNDSRTLDGARKRHDPPFEAVYSPTARQDVQFLYTGNSSALTGTKEGWTTARFDVSDYVGKKVRFGFHAYFSGVGSASGELGHRGPKIPWTDHTLAARGGWWIGDVEVVGTILRADPVLLRLRASVDANVNEGAWQVDDFGVFGARYGRAVGVFADETKTYGAVLNDTVTIPVTIRNMGDSVRRDLAVEVRMDPPQRVNYSADAPKGVMREGDVFRMMGFTLGPGRSVTVNLTIRAPLESPADFVKSTLLVDLKEYNGAVADATGDAFESIPDNEVQGILHRDLAYETAKTANVTFAGIRSEPAVGVVGKPVDLHVTVINTGYARTRVLLECVAQTVEEWHDVDHSRPGAVDAPHVKATSECAQVGNATWLDPGATGTLVFRATPQADGFLTFTLRGRLDAGNASRTLATPVTAAAAVGRSPVAYSATFDGPADVRDAWRRADGTMPGAWSARGNRGAGSLLIGIGDQAASGTTHDYSGAPVPGQGANRSAVSPPIDLHNLTSEPVYLTFWHQDRFARWDGGQVYAEVKANERDASDNAWTQPCILRPVGGYEGYVLSFKANTSEAPDDLNPGARPQDHGTGVIPPEHARRNDWFVSDGPNGGTPEDKWTRAVFNLSDQPACPALNGRTVRFEFRTSVGSPFGVLQRGLGQGWLIDDLSVGPFDLELRPKDQKGLLLDNTTKEFSVLVRNKGGFPDRVRLAFDEANSSTPPGSVRVPGDIIELGPRETRQVIVEVTLPRDPSLLPASYKARILAQSLLDRNADAATVVDLTFAPRPWAELSVTATPPPTGGFAGAETFIPVTVENNGLVESVATTLRITDRWSGGEQVTLLELPAMPGFFQKADEASRTLEYRWRPAEGSVGDHVLTFEVDPEARGEEYTRANNVLSLIVPVGELPLPDLDISGPRALAVRNALGATVGETQDADVTRREVTAGELVTFELKVHNRGRAGATNVQVRAAIGALNLPAKTIPYVAPGAEVAVPFNWLAQKGDHALDFRVVTEQFELSTANNLHPVRGVSLLTVKGFEVSANLALPQDVLAPGTVHRVAFNLTNAGNAGEELVLVGVAPKGLKLDVARPTLFLRPGEIYNGVATLTVEDVAVAGPQLISLQAIARDSPMKVAAAQGEIEVEAHYGGSVDATRIGTTPPVITVPVRLHNEGNSLEPWTVTVKLPPGWVAREALPAKLVVPPRGSATLDLHVTVPALTAPGTRVLDVEARMPDGQTRQGQVTVDVLALRTAAVTLASAEPAPGNGTLVFPLTVENKGNVQQPFEMLLVGVPAGVKAKVEPAVFDLPAGGRTSATLTLTPGANVADGTYAITGYARFAGVGPDTAEGRSNHQSLRVPLARPDLEIGTVDVVPRAGVKAGDRVTIKVPVLNAGPATVTNVPVHLYVDDVFIGETRLPRLAPDARAEATLNWTALPGKHVLTLVVDPYNDTVDADRADNAVSLVLEPAAAGVAGGIAAGRVPGPGAGLVFLAVLGAALLALRTRRPLK